MKLIITTLTVLASLALVATAQTNINVNVSLTARQQIALESYASVINAQRATNGQSTLTSEQVFRQRVQADIVKQLVDEHDRRQTAEMLRLFKDANQNKRTNVIETLKPAALK